MEDASKLALDNVFILIRSSEKKFRQGNFKAAIEEKRKANSLLKFQSSNKAIIDKYKEELSKIYSSKFDLLFDHKNKIDKLKKNEIVKFLEQKSDEKFKKGDYEGAVKSLRRAEKYLSK